jgi:hypothetical protein
MPWPRCSKIDFRKSRARFAAVLLVLLVAPAAFAQLSHETTITPTPGYLSLSILTSGADVDDLFGTLREGLRVRLDFRIRVSSPRRASFRFLGDRLLTEFSTIVEANWDPFLGEYVVTNSDGLRVGYTDEAAFYRDFFHLSDYRIPWTGIRRDVTLVVETSAEYTPIVYVPGLTILALFSANRSETTEWSRHILAAPAGTN